MLRTLRALWLNGSFPVIGFTIRMIMENKAGLFAFQTTAYTGAIVLMRML